MVDTVVDMGNRRRIIHLDMDAFFAAIEERDNPELRGKPVIVGAPPGTRGVVSTCNYIAREYGVRSAMSSNEAYRRCPHAVFVQSHFAKYREASELVHAIMAKYTDKIEFVSLDEGYMDVSGSELLFGSAENIAKELQRRVFETVGTTCSVGVGYSMMSAKCASEEKKPRGFFVINSPEEFMKLTKDRPVGQLYGVGVKTAEKLCRIGIKTIGQLAEASPDRLYPFGNMGIEMKKHAMGQDEREVIPEAPPKSIGRETTFLKDTLDKELLCDTLLLLAEDVGYRLHKKGLWCKTVTLKIKYADMKSITRSRSDRYVRSGDEIYRIAKEILMSEQIEKPIRLIGVATSNLTDTAYEQVTFEDEATKEKSEILNDTIFRLKEEFGRGMLKTAKEIAAEEYVLKEYGEENI